VLRGELSWTRSFSNSCGLQILALCVIVLAVRTARQPSNRHAGDF